MFSLEQIKAEFEKVRSGADFPALIAGFKQIGIAGYEHHVSDGVTIYNDGAEGMLTTPAKYSEIPVNTSVSVQALKNALAIHQRGETDYLTFCRHAASAGVEKWVVNTGDMTCTYYGANGTEMLREIIPA
jgi:uncharacterized protein YbcV (DUF1398 family)